MSTRLPSIFIPACSFPEATMAGVMGSEGLMDATSKAGVCPSSDPAANKVATLMDENIFLGTAVYLAVKALSDIWVGDCKRAATGGPLDPARERVFTHEVENNRSNRWVSSGFYTFCSGPHRASVHQMRLSDSDLTIGPSPRAGFHARSRKQPQ